MSKELAARTNAFSRVVSPPTCGVIFRACMHQRSASSWSMFTRRSEARLSAQGAERMVAWLRSPAARAARSGDFGRGGGVGRFERKKMVIRWAHGPATVVLAIVVGSVLTPTGRDDAAASTIPAATARITPPPLATVAPTVPLPMGATRLGPIGGSDRTSVDVVLRPRSATGLAQLARRGVHTGIAGVRPGPVACRVRPPVRR